VETHLLNPVAREETQQLDGDSLQSIRRRIIHFGVQDGGANVASISDVGMRDFGVHMDGWRRQGIVGIEVYSEMHESIAFDGKNQATGRDVFILDVEGNIWVGLGLNFGDVLQETDAERRRHGGMKIPNRSFLGRYFV
jgi:hypothetical protein